MLEAEQLALKATFPPGTPNKLETPPVVLLTLILFKGGAAGLWVRPGWRRKEEKRKDALAAAMTAWAVAG